MIDAQQDSMMTCEDSTSMVESHNKFMEEYFESIETTVECSLIKGMEDLKMEKEDVQDYIDDEYLSMNGTLYAMKDVLGELPSAIGVIKVDLLGLYKFMDDLGGYMNVSFTNKWNEIAKLLGLAQEYQEAVKECYKEFIGMVKIYYEEAKRSKQERPGKEVVGNDRGTVRLKEPQAFAGMNVKIGNLLNVTPNGTAQVDVKNKGNSEETTNKDLEDYTSSSDDLINSFKVLDKEEDERKFIFSYGVGEAIVETRNEALLIPNIHYTPEIIMNVLSIEQLENQGYVMTYERNRCGIRYMFDNEEGMIDAQQDSVMTCEDLTSMVESHNKFLEEYFESIDPTVECLLVKGMEDLKMEKEDVQDYIDDEYLSMNGMLYAMKVDLLGIHKFVDDLGGYMNVSFNNKWNDIAKLLGLAQEYQEAVKECYKEFIVVVKIYYEEAKRLKQERPGKEVVGNDRGTVELKEPQAFAGMNAEIGN
nr:ARID DNA-binding domain-containing protein [Tanacetum cinerariifolium]